MLKKIENELQNVFLQDTGSHFKNLSSNIAKNLKTNIVAQKGIIKEKKKIILLNGQIISSKNNDTDIEIIKFEQLNVDLTDINTNTIKSPNYKRHQHSN